MRDPDTSWPVRARRGLAAAGLAALAAGTLLLLSPAPGKAAATARSSPPSSASSSSSPRASTSPGPSASRSPAASSSPHASASGSPTASSSASSSPTSSASASPAPSATSTPGRTGSSVTVTGPRLWDPAHKGLLALHSTVTVSQTRDLVAQMVQVSWHHFTPSSQPQYDAQSALYSVMIAECKGTHPTRWKDCYMAGQGAQPDIQGPYGPSNAVFVTTSADGTGQAGIAIETGVLNTMLGCTSSSPCSLAIIPGQGGNGLDTPPKCSDHSLDATLAAPNYTFNSSYGGCSWNNRIMVPLRFSPAATGCQVSNPAFTADGSPVLARAMQQWLTGLCGEPHGFGVLYDSEVGEPEAIGDTFDGLSDIALTSRPASADHDIIVNPPAGRSYVYAPLAITAASVAYWMDDPATGQPYTGLRLNQRLLVKLLTTSYNFGGDGCLPKVRHAAGLGCDSGVNNNPRNLYEDPEFQQLNPGVQAPPGGGGQFQVPTVQAGNYDLTWTVTRWIAADSAAGSFIGGTPDPWHMHIDTAYKGMAYPTDSFLSQDQYQVISRQFSPVYPPERVALYQSENWDPGTQWQKDPVTGNFPANSPEAPGARSLTAIMGDGDAAAYSFPVMAIPNAAGRYVQPTQASMAAAAAHLVSSGSGTEQVDLASTDPAVYPLTVVVYAMVPTSGLYHPRATAIARFLDYVASTGQRAGVASGELPPGYLPLPASMRAQTRQIAARVAREFGPKPTPANGGGTPGASPAAGGTPSGAATPAPAPGGTLGSKTPGSSVSLPAARSSQPSVTVMAVAHPVAATSTRFALPALLIVGGLAAVAGSAALATAADAATRLRRWASAPRARPRPPGGGGPARGSGPGRAFASWPEAVRRTVPRAPWRKR